MSKRVATRIGLPYPDKRLGDAFDVVAFHEPSAGALARTKGTLFLLAQLTDGTASLAKAAREALDAIQRDYYYDLSAGITVSLSRALAGANRRLYHGRRRLGIPGRAGVSIVAVVVSDHQAHVVKLGPAVAVIVRDGRMYEVPPSPAVVEEDPRMRRRRVAASLGEALEVEPYIWHGAVAADDRIALVSRHFAHTVGTEELKRALAAMTPAQAIAHLQHVFAIRGGSGSDGIIAIEVVELSLTAATHHLEPVRPAEPLAGLPDRSPVPLADPLADALRSAGRVADESRSALGRGMLTVISSILAFVPDRRPRYPRTIPRTDEREQSRRRRAGLAGMVAVAGILAVGTTVAGLPSARPTEAIPRASAAREAIGEAAELVAAVEERVEGADLVDRDPERASELLHDAHAAVERASLVGVGDQALAPLRRRIDGHLDALYLVTRVDPGEPVVELSAALEGVDPVDMVAASDGSLWIRDAGHGRILRADTAEGTATVIYRAGQAIETGETPGEPWLLATAATDVVVIDRERVAWRVDLVERIPRRMPLAGAAAISSETTLIGALQHRPPLEIFTLYVVDGANGEITRWSPPPVIPVTYPEAGRAYLTAPPDLDPRRARDLRVDANVWLLHGATVTRVDFGTPRDQGEYSLDRPPDAALRPELDYRLLDGATVGDRDFLYVYDAANARILAFQRADGAFVRQWMAPTGGAMVASLADVRGLAVSSVSDGPPVAFLLTAEGVLRLVLE